MKGRTMLSRLNGWHRIGVVLAVLWLLLVFACGLIGYTNLETGRGPFVETIPGQVVVLKKGTEGRCTQMNPKKPAPYKGSIFDAPEHPNCAPGHYVEATPDVTRQLPAQHIFHFGNMLVVAIIPPVLVWFLLLVAVTAVRWIANGFRPNMKKPSRSTLVLVGSLVSLALALHFGLTAHSMLDDVYGNPNRSITDWGKVALTLVFGFAAGLGLASLLRKSE